MTLLDKISTCNAAPIENHTDHPNKNPNIKNDILIKVPTLFVDFWWLRLAFGGLVLAFGFCWLLAFVGFSFPLAFSVSFCLSFPCPFSLSLSFSISLPFSLPIACPFSVSFPFSFVRQQPRARNIHNSKQTNPKYNPNPIQRYTVDIPSHRKMQKGL